MLADSGWRRLAARAVVVLLGLFVLAALAVGAAVAWYEPQLPPLDRVTDYRPRQHLQVYTADGVEIAQFGSERRIFVPLAQVPLLLQNAVLAVEDWQFREHGGLSLRGLARAALADVSGGMPQGASTITQQVARTFFLSTRRTAERKIKEALLAMQIERRLSKDQILELYLNQIYLGQHAYGFGAASQVYFGKPLTALSVAEVAMLAGLPQNPGYANPITNLERAKHRQLIVLGRMRDTGVIDEATRAQAAAEPLQLRSPGQYDVHAQYVAEMARRIVVDRLGDKAYTDGIHVVTSVRAADQEAAYQALRRAVLEHEAHQPWRGPEDQEDLPDGDDAAVERAATQALKDHPDDEDLRVAIVLSADPKEVVAMLSSGETVIVNGAGLRLAAPGLRAQAPASLALRRGAIIRVRPQLRAKVMEWTIVQWPQAEAALVAMDPSSGRLRALVGGFDFTHQPFNHVTQAWRQPGSAFKPFVYSAAFEAGVSPDTVVDDTPWTGDGTDGNPWAPKNADGRYDGPITVREGLNRSKNMIGIRLLEQAGVAATRTWATRFGFDAGRLPDNLTLALGAGSTTPLQLAGAYAMLANGGFRVAPVLIERISDAQGHTLFEAAPAAPPVEADRAVPARNVFLVDSLLNDVARVGTAARAQAALQRPDLYGKTGTTNDAVDAWFAGFQPGVVAVAWMGYDDNRSLGAGESGGSLALPMWIDTMAQMLRDVPVQLLQPPDGVVMDDADPPDWRYADPGDVVPVPRIAGDPVPAAGAASAASQPEDAPH